MLLTSWFHFNSQSDCSLTEQSSAPPPAQSSSLSSPHPGPSESTNPPGLRLRTAALVLDRPDGEEYFLPRLMETQMFCRRARWPINRRWCVRY